MNLLPIFTETVKKTYPNLEKVERYNSTFDFAGKIVKVISGALYTLVWFFYRVIEIIEDIVKFLIGIPTSNFNGKSVVSSLFPSDKLAKLKFDDVPAVKFIIGMVILCILLYVIVLVYGIIKGNLKGDTKLQRKVMVSSPKVIIKMTLVPTAVIAVLLFISQLIGYVYTFLTSFMNNKGTYSLSAEIFKGNFSHMSWDGKLWDWDGIKFNSPSVDGPLSSWSFTNFDNAINTWFEVKNNKNWYPLDIVSGQVSYLLALIIGLGFLYGLLKVGYKLLIRTFKLTICIGLAPYVIMQEPIDKGVKYENWKKEILNIIIGVFSYILTFVLAFVVISVIKNIVNTLTPVGEGTVIPPFVKMIFNAVIYVSIGVSMPFMAEKINTIITSGIGGEDSNITGGESDTNILGGNIASKLNPASKIKTKLSAFNDKKKQNRSFKKGSKGRQNSKNGLKSRFMNSKFGKKIKGGWKSTKKGFSLLGKKTGNTKDNLLHGKVGTSKRRLFEAKRLKKAKSEAQKQQTKFEKIKQKRANGQISRTQFLVAKNRVKKAAEKEQKLKDNYKEQLQDKSCKESKFKQYKIQEKMAAYNGDKPKNNSKKGNQLE